jgi:hypothetical protein
MALGLAVSQTFVRVRMSDCMQASWKTLSGFRRLSIKTKKWGDVTSEWLTDMSVTTHVQFDS